MHMLMPYMCHKCSVTGCIRSLEAQHNYRWHPLFKSKQCRNTLDVFHRRCIRKILGLSWQNRVTNEELMRRSGMQALSEIVQTRRLRLAGHVLRLPDVRPARVAMTWIPESGWRTSGRPQMTWRTSFKEDLHRMNLTWYGARRAANDRQRWRNLVAQCPVRDRRN